MEKREQEIMGLNLNANAWEVLAERTLPANHQDFNDKVLALGNDPFGERSPPYLALWEADPEIVAAMTSSQFDAAKALLVAHNHHTEALLAHCKWCGTLLQITEAESILFSHSRTGALTPELDLRKQRLASDIKPLDVCKRNLPVLCESKPPQISEIIAQVHLENGDPDAFGIEQGPLGQLVTRRMSGAYTIAEIEACLKDMRAVQGALDSAAIRKVM